MVQLGFAHGIRSGLLFVPTGLRPIFSRFRVYILHINTIERILVFQD